ncbi:type III-B CRISPR module RAMP protein Cmr1 [Candidatus Poribacteria bacterium]|nr:type III-B CRISPR module RAMP protein Cmr1 [Candidatus Poribacteria bacterium]
MPRAVPDCPGRPKETAARLVTKDYAIRLITPMFGGGVEAGSPDPSYPIRGTAIRGQLQFWWRATRGAVYPDKDALFERHAAVWGTTERASPVEIEVVDVQTDAPASCATYTRRNDGRLQLQWNSPFANTPLPYALFPFQGQLNRPRTDVEKQPADFIRQVSFVLRVRFPESLRQDVETAVWAWVNFGGLGARTRRGCGALFCKELAPANANGLGDWVKQRIPNASPVRDWPTLLSAMRIAANAEPLAAWARAVGLMRDFRQGVNFARNPGNPPSRPGRSRWPEPDTIRRVTNKWENNHQPRQYIPNAFPRAELGLPIVFHYQSSHDPEDTDLYPEGSKRMASPLILKPLALADGNAIPMILRLATPQLTAVDLKRGNNSLTLPPNTAIRGAHLTAYQHAPFDSPLADAPNTGSALDAFCAYASKKGFTEVQL